jgi:hypothetical protein
VTDDRDLLVADVLDGQVPFREDARPDWTDVLRRAQLVEIRPEPQRRPLPARSRSLARRLLVAAALVVLVSTVAGFSPVGPALAGIGRDAFDGLSSWLQGQPGEPASPDEQAGFSERNAASYASFPSDTSLRLLLRQTVRGKTLSLLGFRDGSSLCLRLVRSDLPAGRGENQCVTLLELERYPAPALVVAQAWFRFGEDALSAEGVFGFADDTVAAVEVRHARSGWRSVRVASNVFLAMRARPSGSAKDPPPFDPIVQVRALTRAGERVPVPFVANDAGNYGQGLPGVPSYLRGSSIRPEDLPGPRKMDVPFAGGTIGWLERREPRGEPFPPHRRELGFSLGTRVFARRLQPDPESAVRVGATLFRASADSRMLNVRPGEIVLCVSEIRPLGRGTGYGCNTPGPQGPFPAGDPLSFTFLGPEQITQLAGLAADQVAAIDLYLASGRIVPAALRDNAFLVQAPTTQLPGKLVAYDDQRRVIGMQPLPGAAKPAPCPPAAVSGSASLPPRPYERIDLGTAQINGRKIFGRSVGEVVAALGKPDRVGYFSSTNGVREPTLFYGGDRHGAALEVRFGVRQKRLRAFSLTFNSARLVDQRIGQVLRMQPLELQRRIGAAYGDRYELGVAYGSQPGRGCIGIFETNRRNATVTFGVNPYASHRPSLTLWHGY